jgi:tetratricopeptide (TPR) repeat protein
MTNSGVPPESSGDAKSNSGFESTQKQRFELMIAQARGNKKDAEKLLLTAAAHAREWQQDNEFGLALGLLAEHHLSNLNYSDALDALKELQKVQAKDRKMQNHPATISTIKRMGVCYSKLRRLDKAVETLRDAMVRCQSSTEELVDEMIDCLIQLSTVYRHQEKADQSRICIRQAFAIAEEVESIDMQIQVLEELALVTQTRKRPKSAALAFIRVLQMKRAAYGPRYIGNADTFISLGMCYMDMRNFKDAESCFIQALEIIRDNNSADRDLIGATLSKLGGVYHAMGNFVECTIIEQGASEIIGRGLDMRLGVFKQFDAALSAQRNGHLDLAQSCYRQALVDLEATFHRQAFVRIPVLCRLYEIAIARKQRIQAKTILVEIEEGLGLICAHESTTDLRGKALRLARIFRLLGFNEFADSCYRFARLLARQQKDAELISLVTEHALLMVRMEPNKERSRSITYARRLRRMVGLPGMPQQSMIEEDINKKDLSQIKYISDILDGMKPE